MKQPFDVPRKTDCYSEHYEWFVDLARNFHRIQTETVRAKNDFAVVCHGDLVYISMQTRVT